MSIKNIKNGAILVARPSLSLDIFNRSVILIVDHTDEGTVGFILNKSTSLPLNIVVSNFKQNFLVYEGGPVENGNVYYLHSRPDLIQNSIHVANNIYWSGDFEDVMKALDENLITENEIKFFIGYTGWGKNQLQNEIENLNEWEILYDTKVEVFNPQDHTLWKSLMKKIGGENLIWLNTPNDPSMN